MSGSSTWQFGLIVAYVLPGFIGLIGLAPFSPAVLAWLRPVGPDVGPAMYAILAAAAVGLIVSCVRWMVLDRIHSMTGIRRPTLDDRQLRDVLVPFDYLVQNHFRYYEFCGNSLVAIVSAYALNRSAGTLPFLNAGTDLLVVAISFVLFAASRDALANYYMRTGRLVGEVAKKGSGSHV